MSGIRANKRVLAILLFILGLMPAISVYSAETIAGKTLLTVGSVFSQRESAKITLKRRSEIFEKDEIHVGNGGRAQLRMIDSALISLQQNSVLQIKKYQYQKGNQGNSALLELLSGGLRTITGAIGKNNKKAYELRTPLATIGIRGTNYEVEIVANGMYVGVWDGVIHLRSLLRNGCSMELGKSRKFSFIFIDRFGRCSGLDKAPDVFSSGHSYPPVILPEVTALEERIPPAPVFPFQMLGVDQGQPSVNQQGRASALNTATPTFKVGDSLLNNINSSASDFKQSIGGYSVSWGYWGEFSASDAIVNSAKNVADSTDRGLLWTAYDPTSPDIVSARTGSVRYDNVIDSLTSASQGAVSNLAVQMDMNFDTGNVTNGALSANTPEETWIAVFDGQIQSGELELQLNGASVVNSEPTTPSPARDASGFIAGDFVGDNAEAVIGAFGFSEDASPDNHIEGVFIVE